MFEVTNALVHSERLIRNQLVLIHDYCWDQLNHLHPPHI